MTFEQFLTLSPAIGAILVIGRYWHRIDKMGETLEKIDERTRFASCQKNSEAISALRRDLKGVSKSISYLKSADGKFSKKNSPRKLNALGERIFREIKGAEFLGAHQEELLNQIAERKPKTAYDVEKYAREVCLDSTDDEMFNAMKDFVYNAPSYMVTDEEGKDSPYDLTLEDVCFILSIPLRDMYLAEKHF